MTRRQVYQELAKIAGYRCADDKPFVTTDKCLKSNLRHVQSHLRALMEKLDYNRAFGDFWDTQSQARRPRAIAVSSQNPIDPFEIFPTLEEESPMQNVREQEAREE